MADLKRYRRAERPRAPLRLHDKSGRRSRVKMQETGDRDREVHCGYVRRNHVEDGEYRARRLAHGGVEIALRSQGRRGVAKPKAKPPSRVGKKLRSRGGDVEIGPVRRAGDEAVEHSSVRKGHG